MHVRDNCLLKSTEKTKMMAPDRMSCKNYGKKKTKIKTSNKIYLMRSVITDEAESIIKTNDRPAKECLKASLGKIRNNHKINTKT